MKRTSRGTAKRRRSEQWVKCLDALAERCARIETFAALLAACGHPPHGEPLARATVGHTGELVREEVEQIRELLYSLERSGTRP